MNTKELDDHLFQVTPSELKHQQHPDQLSEKYKLISTTQYYGRTVYQFTFNSLWHGNAIAVNRESRWTHIPEHVHTVVEILYVYHGECTQYIEGKPVHMDQGDLCMLDQNVLHSIGYIDEKDILISIEMRKEYLIDHLMTKFEERGAVNTFLLDALAMENTHDQYLVFRKTNAAIKQVIQQILCEYYDQQFCSMSMIDSYMVLLFCYLIRQYRTEAEAENRESGNRIMEILSYMEKHYQDLSLEELAKHFGFHPNYMSALIRKNTGRTFRELIILQKMSKACWYLTATDLPIYEIASEIGYSNLGFFYQKFAEIYHESPQQYRDRNHSASC